MELRHLTVWKGSRAYKQGGLTTARGGGGGGRI